MLVVPCLGRRGGLAMLWKEEVDLNIQTYNQNHINALILTKQNMSWRITGFYGKPEEHLRHETWDLLKYLSTLTSTPWLCIGDYNEILSAEEKDGRLPKPMHLMQEFRSTLLHCGLIDLGYTEIFLHGKRVVREMIMCKNSLIELVQRWHGGNYFLIVEYHIFLCLTLIICPLF